MDDAPRDRAVPMLRCRPISTLTISLALTALGALVLAGLAQAISAPIHITEGVNIRPGPSTSSGSPIGGIPAGKSPDYHCWTQGQNINGVDVWFKITWAGKTGYYASYYDDSHYATDSQITSKYHIPRCSTSSGGGTTAAEAKAIKWARPYADAHNRSYNRLCLTFVFRAYQAAGINLRNWVKVPIGANTYPQDIWGHFSHGHTGKGTPPAGALVFFKARNGDRHNSHVALSIGGGKLVSTSDSVAGYTHYETVAQHSYAIYQGWWLPDR